MIASFFKAITVAYQTSATQANLLQQCLLDYDELVSDYFNLQGINSIQIGGTICDFENVI